MTIDVLRRQTIFAIASGLLGPNVAALTPDAECSTDHREWVSSCLKRMLTVQPGMARVQLMQVFTTEGGIVFSALQQTFVSRDCPFFKAEVRFDRARGVSAGQFEELDTDVIATISRPYLQFTIAD